MRYCGYVRHVWDWRTKKERDGNCGWCNVIFCDAGLPALRMPRISCSAERKETNKKGEVSGLPQLAAAVTSAATLAYAHPVFALVDERLSGEGTGLGLGISNPRLTWILVGVTALVWVLYFVYSSNLPEGDDDSGLSL